MGEESRKNLAQRMVLLRSAVPAIIKKKYSDAVKYKFAKIDDVYELLSPAMNAAGVDWDIVKEVASKRDENGNGLFWETMEQKTKMGARTVYIYEADLTLIWYNVDDKEDFRQVQLHAIGTNDSGPEKAKGAAWTYCLKYYLFEKFNIDMGEEDPDQFQYAPDDGQYYEPQKNYGRKQPAENKEAKPAISDDQMDKLVAVSKLAGMTPDQVVSRTMKKYNCKPENMTQDQMEETLSALGALVKKSEEGVDKNAE